MNYTNLKGQGTLHSANSRRLAQTARSTQH